MTQPYVSRSEWSTLVHFLNSHSPSSLLSSSFCSTPSTGGCLGEECQCPLGLQTPRAPLTLHLAWPLSALGTPSHSSFPVVWHGFLLVSAPLPLYFLPVQLLSSSCWGFSFRSWVMTFISKSRRFSSELQVHLLDILTWPVLALKTQRIRQILNGSSHL